MTSVTISVEGAAAAQQMMRGLAERAANTEPAMSSVADEMLAGQADWWASQGHGSWPPLAESTLRIKASRGQPATMLVATGALRASLTSKGATGQTLVVSRDQALIGTRVAYARFVTRRRGVIAPPDAERIAETILAWLVEGQQ
jgi:phage gpG-like protein